MILILNSVNVFLKQEVMSGAEICLQTKELLLLKRGIPPM